ncbi:hypothetical protein [Staphylococcus saprophyticus]|nr:hypothetical protein [Staphylococcus saprophyticus]
MGGNLGVVVIGFRLSMVDLIGMGLSGRCVNGGGSIGGGLLRGGEGL